MLPRSILNGAAPSHLLRPACGIIHHISRSRLPFLWQARELRTTPSHNDLFPGLLSLSKSFIPPDSPADHDETTLEPTSVAPAAQDNRKRSSTITTLCPEWLTSADVLHLPREAQTLTVSFKPLLDLALNAALISHSDGIPCSNPVQPLNGEADPRAAHAVTLYAASGASDWEGVKFPAGLGCFYYWSPTPPCTPLAGAVRFRLLTSLSGDSKTWTDQSVRAAFKRGKDFCVHPGMPWQIPLLTIGSYDVLKIMLLRENLVDKAVMRDAEVEGSTWNLKRHSSRAIHSFGQPFIFDLSATRVTFYFLGRRTLHTHVLRDLCSWNLEGSEDNCQPFIGKLLCSFERSTYPGHRGEPYVVIRILKVLSPVTRNPRYSGPQDIPLPRPGSLLARGIRRVGAPHPSSDTHKEKRSWTVWSANIKRVFKQMRVLFENDPKGMPSGRR